ncbi:GH92 family glycosyl hydrolase [Maribacter sp. 2307ULW6-5]|uniref:GH92 family glycosyl hydrolase n=1 Tax=Maribacter sp. 2307ULW6-5 TaxID=3386275 RepID=UPI0039BD3597
MPTKPPLKFVPPGTITFLSIALLLCFTACRDHPVDGAPSLEKTTAHVDPFIGTGGHGHTYPGASAPFGMVQPSPDNGTSGWDWCSGYHITDSIISGFGQLHLSGTGIGDLTDVLLMPTNAPVDVTRFGTARDTLPYTSGFSHDNEAASPGYYRVLLDAPKVEVELTANEMVAFHRYTYRKQQAPSFILDLGYAVNWDKPTQSGVTVENEHLISGHRFSTGWAKNQKVFFVIESATPITKYQLVSDGSPLAQGANATGTKTGGQFFVKARENTPLLLKIALSSVSVANAKENLERHGKEIGFAQAKTAAERDWEGLLSRIEVETPVDSLKTIFYSALYHTQLAPVRFNDSNGQFRLQNDSIAQMDGTAYTTLSLWDTFRAQNPLLTLMHPDRVNDIIASMLRYYEEQGRLPVWNLYGNETDTMTGNHGVSVIAEAYLKGIRGYDVEKAYAAVVQSMMADNRGLDAYKAYGYIPHTALDESVSITLEYAYNDWCVAQMAKEMGKMEDYEYFGNRSRAYTHLFDAGTGFMRGRDAEGKMRDTPFDPKHSSHRVDSDYVEGNAWQHSWFVLHDVPNFIDLHGGDQAFAEKLEQLFSESSEITGDNVSVDITGLIGQYAHGNEPSHHIAYMFNTAKQPWRTQFWVREIMDSQYSTLPDGLSGNEDCGQMSAWYVLSSLGFYPMNPVSGTYELGSPLFQKAVISLPQGKKFTILAPNTSDTNKYINNVSLNGTPLERTHITHAEIMAGGTLAFDMASEPNTNWGIN